MRPVPSAGLHGVFVAGTDTDVGKTVVAACLVRGLQADYWKPVQSGLADANDTAEVARLAELDTAMAGALPPVRGRVHPIAYGLTAPLSPHEAARLDGVRIDLDRIVPPATPRPLVVEGAGGVLVPLNDRHLMIDLVARLGLPVVLVARSRLGTINHTLLSLAALRDRGLAVAAVVMNGPPDAANRTALEHYGRIPVKECPWVDRLDAGAVARMAPALVDGPIAAAAGIRRP